MQREDLPLMLASSTIHGDVDRDEPLDRIRMQKGIFLIAMKGPAEWRQMYEFEPYDWGPYSSMLQTDLSSLIAANQLTKEPWPGRRYHQFEASQLGEAHVLELLSEIPENYQDFVRRVRSFVTTRSFRQLLKDVYAEFPEYASKSRFKG